MEIDMRGYIQTEYVDIPPKGPIHVRYDVIDERFSWQGE
jgi:hypothetical protein